MSRFNRFMEAHFAGCRLLAKARDNCRNRDVSIYQVPGEFETVGVSDGTDCWMAPVAADPFSVSVKRILDDLREGKSPAPVISTKRTRVRVDAPQDEQPKERTRVRL